MRRSQFPWAAILLAAAPFIVMVVIYLALAQQRHRLNPDDPLLPMPAQLWARFASCVSLHSSDPLAPLWMDVGASLGRLLVSLLCSGGIALVLAVLMHETASLRSLFAASLVTVAKVPPVALLPILLLWFGVNEKARIALIVLGLTPYLCIQLLHDLEEHCRPLKDKMKSLRLPRWQRIFFVDVPLIWPTFLHQMQVLLGQAWLFLLVAETFGATHGLGYRIFVVRRYLAMDIIFVYVLCITLLSVAMYSCLGLWRKRLRWHASE
jgi:NitT/TauT family transport system permease protein